MNKYDDIKFILEDYYPTVREFLGEIIKQRLQIQNYENGILTSSLINATSKINSEEFGEFDEIDEKTLDIDLYRLDQTLDYAGYGEKYCKGFNLIFSNIDLSQYQDADAKIMDILAEVKAFELLYRQGFGGITRIQQTNCQPTVHFTANKNNENYAIVVTRLSSAQDVEEHSNAYEIEVIEGWLTRDIANTIDQQYPQIKEFCQRKIGPWKGIIFISSGRDYFGAKRYENKLYGRPLNRVTVVLNKEWRKRKGTQEGHKYLDHIVITMGKNILKAMIYPGW